MKEGIIPELSLTAAYRILDIFILKEKRRII